MWRSGLDTGLGVHTGLRVSGLSVNYGLPVEFGSYRFCFEHLEGVFEGNGCQERHIQSSFEVSQYIGFYTLLGMVERKEVFQVFLYYN